MTSYRDPAPVATLEAFAGAGAHLHARGILAGSALADDLRKAIVASIGAIDAPMSPQERGDTSLARLVAGIDDTALQRRRWQVLSASPADICALADATGALAERGRTWRNSATDHRSVPAVSHCINKNKP